MKLSMIPGPKRPIVLLNDAGDKGKAQVYAKRTFGDVDVVFVNNGVSTVFLSLSALHDMGLKRIDGAQKIILLMKGVKPKSIALKQLERLLPDDFADLIALKEIPVDLGKLADEALAKLGLVRMTAEELEAYLVQKLEASKPAEVQALGCTTEPVAEKPAEA